MPTCCISKTISRIQKRTSYSCSETPKMGIYVGFKETGNTFLLCPSSIRIFGTSSLNSYARTFAHVTCAHAHLRMQKLYKSECVNAHVQMCMCKCACANAHAKM